MFSGPQYVFCPKLYHIDSPTLYVRTAVSSDIDGLIFIEGDAMKKSPNYLKLGLKVGDDILSQFYLVPSALTGLTSLFDMERGDPCC